MAVLSPGAGDNIILWSGPGTAATGPRRSKWCVRRITSWCRPSVVRRAAGDWWMFAVNVRRDGLRCRGHDRGGAPIRRRVTWGDPEPSDLSRCRTSGPGTSTCSGFPSRSEFWAVYNAKTATVAPRRRLHRDERGRPRLAGPRAPVIAKGATADAPGHRLPHDIRVRSGSPTRITFWFSGARYEAGTYVWGAAVERRHRADLFVAQSGGPVSPPPAPLQLPPAARPARVTTGRVDSPP